MSCIPTAVLWKIFYSHCLYVFIDCKNVFLALGCATGVLDGARATLWVCCGAWRALGDTEGGNSATDTFTHMHIHREPLNICL